MSARLRSLFRNLLHRKRVEQDLSAEVQSALEILTQQRIAVGVKPREARRQALLELGGLEQVKEEVRQIRMGVLAESVWQDARHAIRAMRQAPGFTLVVVFTLALGIGANVVIFGVVDAALFRPLPYAHADRLVDLFVTGRTPDGKSVLVTASGRNLDDLRAIRHVFDAVDGFTSARPRALATGSNPSLWVGAFTPTFLDMLGAAPQLGRGFDDGDVLAGDRIIISDHYWQRVYNRDPGVLGTTVAFSDLTAVIVGVMPPTFRHFVGSSTDVWLPLTDRNANHLVARLRPGLTLEQAQREVNAPSTTRPVDIVSGDWWRAGGPLSVNGRSTRTMLFSLLAAVGCLLAIACANVAGVLLARTHSRKREIVVRSTLGATRGRLTRQFLTEGMVLTGLGSVMAILAAWWGIKAVPVVMPAEMTTSVFGVSWPVLDLRVLAFGSVVAILTGVLSGIVPALRASRSVIEAGGSAVGRGIAGPSRGERRSRNFFQAVQVALTVVLLAAAVLLITSMARMMAVPAGYDGENLGFAQMTLPRNRPLVDAPERAMFDALLARIRSLPGVSAATVGPPPVSGFSGAQFLAEESSVQPFPVVPLEDFYVRPDYFHVAGIPLKEGRSLQPEDQRGALLVAVVSDNVASRFWPGQSAIGRRFRRYPDTPPVTVVGVVRRPRTTLLPRDGVVAYMPSAQVSEQPNLLFRMSGNPTPTLEAIRHEIRASDASLTMIRIGLVQNLFVEYDPTAPARFYAVVFGAFAGLGLLIAAVGLYGLLSSSVSRRTQEIGVRIALGASRSRMHAMLIGEIFMPVASGIVVGVIAAMWLARFVVPLLFRVQAQEPIVLGTIVTVVLGAAAVGAFVPLRRAMRIDPAQALRAE